MDKNLYLKTLSLSPQCLANAVTPPQDSGPQNSSSLPVRPIPMPQAPPYTRQHPRHHRTPARNVHGACPYQASGALLLLSAPVTGAKAALVQKPFLSLLPGCASRSSCPYDMELRATSKLMSPRPLSSRTRPLESWLPSYLKSQ